MSILQYVSSQHVCRNHFIMLLCFKVEKSDFCREILTVRIREGCLEEAELHPDVLRYRPTGSALDARALMAGWPCQA